MRVNPVHSSGAHRIHTYRALRNKGTAVERDVVSETVHTTVILIFISFAQNEDLVTSVSLADDIGPLCAEAGWSHW